MSEVREKISEIVDSWWIERPVGGEVLERQEGVVGGAECQAAGDVGGAECQAAGDVGGDCRPCNRVLI